MICCKLALAVQSHSTICVQLQSYDEKLPPSQSRRLDSLWWRDLCSAEGKFDVERNWLSSIIQRQLGDGENNLMMQNCAVCYCRSSRVLQWLIHSRFYTWSVENLHCQKLLWDAIWFVECRGKQCVLGCEKLTMTNIGTIKNLEIFCTY
jgi:hypothetical protein